MKRVVVLLLTVLLAIGPAAAFAAGGDGDTATVTLKVTSNSGAMTAKVSFSYDTSALEFVSAHGENTWIAPQNGNGSFGFASADSVIPVGNIGTITFRIKRGAAPGQYPVNAVVTKAVDTNYRNVSLSVSGGSVTVSGNSGRQDNDNRHSSDEPDGNNRDYDDYYPSGTSDEEIRISRADASSWIVGKDPSSYIPAKMIDGNETTAFQFSVKTTPLGSAYVYFYFEAPSTVRSLWIKNGFWKITNGLDQYTRNCRVKAMKVEFMYSNAGSFTDGVSVSLPDDQSRSDWTKVDLGTHDDVTAVRFTIKKIYKGSKFKNDVCISEVRFTGRSTGSSSSSDNYPVSSGDLYGLAVMKLATRSGPGTQYQGKGSYNVAGQYIKILSRAWDSRNGIWWVKCEIPYKGQIRVLWTGYKRFDSSTIPLESIPVENY